MLTMSRNEYFKASEFARHNKTILQNDKLCGCYRCLRIFPTHDINEYCLEGFLGNEELTAICPYCKVDSLIGEGSEYPINVEFLRLMYGYAFAVGRKGE